VVEPDEVSIRSTAKSSEWFGWNWVPHFATSFDMLIFAIQSNNATSR
jgi:hypothetical protein